jgi:hypothetical protein
MKGMFLRVKRARTDTYEPTQSGSQMGRAKIR